MSNLTYYGRIIHEGLSFTPTEETQEPVTLEYAKAHSRVEFDYDDGLFAVYNAAARSYCEAFTKSAVRRGSYTLVLDTFPVAQVANYYGPIIKLPVPPLVSVESITYLSNGGDTITVDDSIYNVDAISQPGRIILKPNRMWPVPAPIGSAVTITFTAGHTPDTCPENYKLAIMLLVDHFYKNRSATVDGSNAPLNFAVESLLSASMPCTYA